VEDGKFSLLDGIPGIGEKRSRKLLREFGSLEKLREATPEEIRERAGIPASIVETLLRWLSAWDGSEDELLIEEPHRKLCIKLSMRGLIFYISELTI
jgi:5'-3' exonuclease